ncbi:DUF192 domain-containing protein [Lacinutrix undariae]
MQLKALTVFSVISLGMLSILNISCKEEQKTVKPIVISFEKEGELTLRKANSDSLITSLDIEIADDDYQTQTGLMYRDHMDKKQGMLFIFPDERPRSFYMKNTRIPLDIIYINTNKKVVSIQKNARPFNETSLPSEGPTKYVLEINGGLADTWNIETGDTVDFSILK